MRRVLDSNRFRARMVEVAELRQLLFRNFRATRQKYCASTSVFLAAAFTSAILFAVPAYARWNGNHEDQLSVQVLNDLSFGTVVIGRDIQKRIPFTDADAARALVDGFGKNETVSMIFYLPTFLQSGDGHLQIQFDASSAAWSPYNDPGNATAFNPNSRLQLPSSALVTGKLYLWLGATIYVQPQQPSGQYQGDIRVQVNIDHDED